MTTGGLEHLGDSKKPGDVATSLKWRSLTKSIYEALEIVHVS